MTYVSADSAIVAPDGWGEVSWLAYTPEASASARKAMIVFGDSTTFGAGGPPSYSWLQRIRDRAADDGYTHGGKGLFAGLEQEITYDSPEINGIVSSTFAGSADSYDTLVGSFLFDAGTVGHQQVCQFRETGVRIWYMKRNGAGDFTYSVDGSSPVTVHAQQSGNPEPAFVHLTGLGSYGTTKTLTIVNAGGGEVHVAIDPINATGLQVQKQAMSGATFGGFFYAFTASSPFTQASDGFRFQAPMGLVPNVSVQGSDSYAGMTVDTSIAAGSRINPCLAIAHLGFNDLTSAAAFSTAYWTEYVRRFAAACRAASVDGVIVSGQLPYNANWVASGAARFNALKDEALAQGLAFVDAFYPIGGPSLGYAGGESNPHLSKTEYIAQADYIWDGLLTLTLPASGVVATKSAQTIAA